MQHATLSAERWRRFSLDQQILMIGNEMHRASSLFARSDRGRLHNCYERVLRLADLTIEVNERRALRRELLRWRDLAAELYIAAEPDPGAHARAFQTLLLMTPVAARQLSALPILLTPNLQNVQQDSSGAVNCLKPRDLSRNRQA